MGEALLGLVDLLNRCLLSIFSFLLWPFASVSPIWPLLALSLLTGLSVLWIFSKVSDQVGIRRVKKSIQGNLLGVRLFQHDVGVVLRLQGRILRETLTYLKYSLIPMLIVVPPLLVIVIHLSLYFERAPVVPGASVIVKTRLASGWTPEQKVGLLTSDAVTVETPPVRIPGSNEVSWRVRVERVGHHQVKVQVGQDQVEKELFVGEHWGAVSPFRTKDVWHQIQFPGESSIPLGSKVEAIGVSYPDLNLTLMGWDCHWLLLFFMFSVISALVFRRPLGVEI